MAKTVTGGPSTVAMREMTADNPVSVNCMDTDWVRQQAEIDRIRLGFADETA